MGAKLAASDRAPIGAGFRFEYRVHAGARTEVWQGIDPQGSTVAIKLASRTAAQGSVARQLRAEYGLLERLSHPSILRPIALVEEPSEVALVTEYLAGGDLVSLADFPARYWAHAALAVLEALATLHAHGVVHRDVKARNVMFDAAGHARLIDFGSAAAVGSRRSAAGTTAEHRYSESGTVAPDDDIHAFAVLLYELMAGRLPFRYASERGLVTLPPPLPPEHRSTALRALERLVLKTLGARESSAQSSIAPFRDGIKSVLAEKWDRT